MSNRWPVRTQDCSWTIPVKNGRGVTVNMGLGDLGGMLEIPEPLPQDTNWVEVRGTRETRLVDLGGGVSIRRTVALQFQGESGAIMRLVFQQ